MTDQRYSKLTYKDSNGFAHYKNNGEDIIVNYTGDIVNNSEGRHIKSIPNGVTKIEHHAFYYCGSSKGPFDEITIPTSVREIGSKAFYASSGYLDTINYTGTKEQWSQITLASDWISGAKTSVVHCVDGDVSI